MRPHYPEPWRADRSHVIADLAPDGGCVHVGGHWHDRDETHDDARARCSEYYHGTMIAESVDGPEAARIVACVNALTGVPTAALIEGWVGEMVKTLRSTIWQLSDSDDPQVRRLIYKAGLLIAASGPDHEHLTAACIEREAAL